MIPFLNTQNPFIKTCSIICIGIVFLYGCKKTGNPPPEPTGPVTNVEINKWITDSLRRYYYWADRLPANPNLNTEPITYFNSIKYNADRFSFIVGPDASSSLSQTSRSKYGFDYLVFQENSSGKILGLITLVLNTSPAHGAGLRRGQYFTRIDGTMLTQDNAAELHQQLLNGTNVKLTRASLDGGNVTEGGVTTVPSGVTFEQTALQTTFNIEGKKIGYLFFTGFNANERESYLTVFDTFKAGDISELILDLRYNGGGDISAAAAMCSMIAAAANSESVFIEYRGNTNGGVRKESFATAATAAGGPSFTQLQQRKLNLTRIYVLTTSATASAAELMINNLKPYINVIQVGQTTRGKDEASITVADRRVNKRIDWVMYPIVYKVFNASGNGNYANGISPDHQIAETENLPLKSFGDITDPMINYTITLTGAEPEGVLKKPLIKLSSVRTDYIYNSASQSQEPLLADH